MAIVKGSGLGGSAAGGAKIPRKKKKKTGLGASGGYAAQPQAAPKTPKAPKEPKYEPSILDRNIAPMSKAFKEKHGRDPSAEEAYHLLTQAPGALSLGEWGGIFNTQVGPLDPFTNNLAKASSAYFDATGRIPTAAKMAAFLETGKMLPGQNDWQQVFNPLKGVEDPKDKTVLDTVMQGSNEESHRKWTKAELAHWGGDQKKADWERKLANAPMRTLGKKWDDFNAADIAKINDAREWYGGTKLKARINARALGLINENGEPNLNAVKSWSAQAKQNDGSLKDPYAFASLQKHLFGKKKLTNAQEADLSSVTSALLAAGLLTAKQIQNHYGSLKGVRWDGFFDGAARSYLLMANLPYIQLGKDDPRYRVAMGNIEIASQGQIKSSDDLKNYLDQLGSLGKPGDLSGVSEQYARQMFGFFLTTNPGMDGLRAAATYADIFGKNALPESIPQGMSAPWKPREMVDQMQSNYANTYLAMDDNPTNILHGVFKGALEDIKAWQIAQKSGAANLYDPNNTWNAERLGQASPNESHAKAVFFSQGRRGGGPSPELVQKRLANEAPGMDVERGFWENGLHNIAAIATTAADFAFNDVEKTAVRIWLTAGLLTDLHKTPTWVRVANSANPQGQMGAASEAVAGAVGGKDTAARVAATNWSNPAFVTNEILFHAGDLSPSNIGRAWQDAGKRQAMGGNDAFTAYTDYGMERAGLDPEKNPFLRQVLYLNWSLMKDIALDQGVGALSNIGKGFAAQVARETLSEARLEKLAAAELKLKEANVSLARQVADDAQGEIDAALRNAHVAEEAGDAGLGQSFRRRATQFGQTKRELSSLLTAAEIAENKGDTFAARELRQRASSLAGQRNKLDTTVTITKGMKLGEEPAKTGFKPMASQYINPADAIETAMNQLKLLERPAWYDPFALGLSQGQQSRAQLMRLFHISTEGMEDPNRIRMLNEAVDLIGKSSDEDEIMRLMVELSDHAGVPLDPGRMWLGKVREWDRVMDPSKAASLRMVLPEGRRIMGGALRPRGSFESVGTLLNMGLPMSRRAEGNRLLNEFIDRLVHIPDDLRAAGHGVTQDRIALETQKLWDEMMGVIESNMRSTVASEATLRKLAFWAKKNGMGEDFARLLAERRKAGEAFSDWDASKVFRTIKSGRKAQKNFIASGVGKKPWYDLFESETPFNFEQLSKDLIAPFNFQDLASYQRGHTSWQMAINTGMMYGHGPSYLGAAEALKLIAIARMGFGFSALFIDEFWRIPVEAAEGNLSLSPRQMNRGRKAAKTSGEVQREISGDAVFRDVAQAEVFEPVVPGAPGYDTWLNATLKQHQRLEFIDELANFPMLEGETVDAYKARFTEHLKQLILEDSEQGEALRYKLDQMGRGLHGGFHDPSEVSTAVTEHRARVAQMHDEVGALQSRIDESSGVRQALRDERSVLINEQEPVAGISEDELEALRMERDDIEEELARDAERQFAEDVGGSIEQPATYSQLREYILAKGGIKRDPAHWSTGISMTENAANTHNLVRKDGTSIDLLVQQLEGDAPGLNIHSSDDLWAWLDYNRPVGREARLSAAELDQRWNRLQEIETTLSGDTTPELGKTLTNFGKPSKTFTEEWLARNVPGASKVPPELSYEEFEQLRPPIPGMTYHGSPQGDLTGLNPFTSRFFPQGVYTTEGNSHALGYARGRTRVFSGAETRELLDAGAQRKPGVEGLLGGLNISDRSLGKGRVNYLRGTPRKAMDLEGPADIEEWKRASGSGAEWGSDFDDVDWSSLSGLTNQKVYDRLAEELADHGLTVSDATEALQDVEYNLVRNGDYDAFIRYEAKKSGHPQRVTIWTEKGVTDGIVKIVPPETAYKEYQRLYRAALKEIPRGAPDLTAEQRLALRNAWKDHVAAQRGLTDRWNRVKEIDRTLARERSASNLERLKAERSRLEFEIQRMGSEPRLDLADNTAAWLDETVNRLYNYRANDELWNALLEGKKLSKKKLDAIRADLQGKGLDLPTIVSARPGLRKAETGYVPGLSRWAEANWGPFGILDKLSNLSRRVSFYGRYSIEYDRLIAAGFRESEAQNVAIGRALDYANSVMYSAGSTATEHELKSVFMFLPAYRQATLYWGKQFLKHPYFMSDVWKNFNTDVPMGWLGDYGMIIPRPFFLSGNIGDAAVPGVAVPILIPLRIANTATGWRKNEGGGYEYTGATKLDWIADIPPLSFMDKNLSPLSWIDDLFWGFAGDQGYPDKASNFFLATMSTAVLALRKDPYARRRLAMNIAQAQIAKGMRPNLDAAQAQIEGSPWWWKMMKRIGVTNPEGVEGALTRQFFINRISYQPSDIGAVQGEKQEWWQKIFSDTEARSIADAEYAFIKAYGDEKQMQAVLDKYPKYKQIYDFRKLDAGERAEYLQNPDHLWIIPYISGKNDYDTDGSTVLANDYYLAQKEGSIRKRDFADYMDGVDKLVHNVGYDEAALKIEADRTAALKKARDRYAAWAKKTSVTPDELKWKLWEYDATVGGYLGKTAGTRTVGSTPIATKYLAQMARDYKLKQLPSKWNPIAINKNFDEALDAAQVANTFTQRATDSKGNHPAYTPYGIEGYYTHAPVGDYGPSYTKGLGRMVAISDTMKDLLPADESALWSIDRSISRKGINDTLKKNAEFNRAAARRILSGEWFKEANPAQQFLSAGVPPEVVGDPLLFNAMAADLQHAYDVFKKQTAGTTDYGSDKYINAHAAYNREVRRLTRGPSGQVFQNGPAGRLLYSYLTNPGNGKVDARYVAKTIKVMAGKDPDVTALVDAMKTPRTAKVQKALAANAWSAVLSVAMTYRKTMANTYNDYMKTKGISTSSNAGKPYVSRLQTLVDAWKRRSPVFKTQWEQTGGDALIETFLSDAS